MLNTFLIDDEPHCTDVLRVLLQKHCPELHISGIFNDPEQALEAIQSQKPGLVFLDIEMPYLNGFDLLHQCAAIPFKLIFTTAYDQYAVRAFRFSALDYLLKPINANDLRQAVQKALSTQTPANPEQLSMAQYLKNTPIPERIALPVGQELILVEVAEVLYCASEGSYATFFVHEGLVKGNKITVSKSLREVEELLNNPGFFRIHNTYLVQVKHIKKIIRNEGGEVVMAG